MPRPWSVRLSSQRLNSTGAAVLSASIAVALVAAAIIVPRLTGEDVEVNWPPLHANWDPRLTWRIVPVAIIGLALWQVLPRWSATWSWPRVLILGYAGSWIWTTAVALTEGSEGLARTYERKGEYVYDAQRVESIPAMLREFISRIPMDAPDNWHTHVAGHPPGAFLLFIWMDRLGITDPFWIGVTTVTIGAAATVALLVTLRVLASEDVARRALPWVVLAPWIVWMGVDGDALFTAIAAAGLMLLAVSAVRFRSGHQRAGVAWGLAAGLVLGYCVFLSYGLTLLGILALAVLLVARSWKPLPWALAGAVVVTVIFWAAGFAWWEAYPVLHERYYDGIASRRSYGYWVWANIAAWSFTVGLATWAAFPRMIEAARRRASPAADSTVVARLAVAALLTIVVATLSGMSKAEVERIWMPFTLWVLPVAMLLPPRWHRPLLLSQIVIALTVQHVLLTRW